MKKTSLYSTSKITKKIIHTHFYDQSTITQICRPTTAHCCTSFLPFGCSLSSYQHSHSPVAMERIHITLAISALGNDTIRTGTQPA